MKPSQVGTFLKAVYGGVAALLAGLASALVGAQSFGAITDAQWITIAALTLAAFGAVYGVTNSPAAAATDGGT